TGGFFYRAGLGYEESNGIDRTVGSTGVDADRDAYREKNYSIAAGYRFDNTAQAPVIRAGWTGAHARTDFDNGVGSDDYTDIRLGTGHIAYAQPLGDRAGIDIIYGHTLDDQRFRGAFPSRFRTRRDSARVVFNAQVAPDSKLIAGLDYYRDKVRGSSSFLRDARENRAFFVEYLGDYDFGSAQLAVRLDDNQAFGDEVTTNAAIGLNVGRSSVLSFSFGTAFKAPTFNDLYFEDLFFSGNPDLQPESSRSYELLFKTAQHRISGYAAIFYTEVDDLIELTSSFATVENLDRAHISGADTGIEFMLGRVNARLGFAYVDAEDARTKQRLPRRPRATGMLDLSTTVGKLDFGLGWNADGDRVDAGGKFAGYNVVDARATWHATSSLRVGAIVRNATGSDYTLVKGFQEFRTEGQTASVFIEFAP
ncbi:MAG: TonB-dependent receptor, partial [Pseudomonadales bacterium]|nr:TonB-dependent receptor [Pseudomonadales bacterium]